MNSELATGKLIELELRRAYLTSLIPTPVAFELASEHLMRAVKLTDSLHAQALHMDALRSL